MSREHDMIDNVADVLVQMADGLEHLHDRGWMHLDYKPENIMVSSTATSLIDFDTAEEIPRNPKYPRSPTPAYMPPEQLKGEMDQRADITWGVTAYELLTHPWPFGGRTPRNRRNVG